MKIGSLFDGSGGFPLAATMCGIEPVWASEVEPYPIAVTRSRFPKMKHLGSVTEVNGAEVEPVDIITFGSPCQDLSVAGKRAGLKHTENGDEETTRSGLFMEAIRIIKEMREATNGEYPRYAIWENVPGAFSSNKGLDFRVVLEEFIRIAEPTAVMPPVPKAGWAYSDVFCGDSWSLAYRVLDAQYWGVPQRRRRIYLVADFRGQRAGKILFEREGLRGYFAQSGASGQATARDAESGIGAADSGDKCYGIDHAITTGGNCTAQGPCVYENIQATLKACGPHAVAYAVDAERGIGTADCERVKFSNGAGGQLAACLYAAYGTKWNGNGGAYSGENFVLEQRDGSVPYTLKIRSGCEGGGKGALVQTDKSATLATNNDQYLFQPVGINGDVAGTLDASYYKGCGMRQGAEREVVAYTMQAFGDYKDCGVASGLKARDYKDATDLVTEAQPIAIDRAFSLDEKMGQTYVWEEQVHTLSARDYKQPKTVCYRYIVRRLTPTECARLQGFPDSWGHPDQKHKLTDEEYHFWLDVRNTHAAINGKTVKDYTKQQMLTWYNKLHTDSSEYKMWGNGIALPCALYVMQGIAEVLDEPRN